MKFPVFMAWQRRLRLPGVLWRHKRRFASARPKTNGALLWCQNYVSEPVAFSIQDVLRERGLYAVCVTEKPSDRRDTVDTGLIRDKHWKRLFIGFQCSLNNALKEIAHSLAYSLGQEFLQAKAFVRLLRSELQNRFLLKAADAMALSARLLDAFQPRVVLVQDPADYHIQSLAWAARKRNIKVINHQFAMIGEVDIEFTWDCADLYLVWGEWSRDTISYLGISACKVLLAGTPRLISVRSEIEGFPRQSPELFRVLFPLIPDSMLGFGNGGALSLAECRSVIELLFRWIKMCHDNIILCIKPRPLGDDAWFESLKADAPAGVEILPRKYPIDQALSEIDLVITTNSTVGIDAIMMEKPLVVLDCGLIPHPFSYAVNNGAAVKVDSTEALYEVSNGLLYNGALKRKMVQDQRVFCRRILQYDGTESSERIAWVLMDELRKRVSFENCSL